MKENKVYLYGASGHGKVVAEIAESNGTPIAGFIDDNMDLEQIWNYPVFHELPSDLEEMVLSVGNNKTRKKLWEKYSSFQFSVLIHSRSTISARTEVGKGSVVMAGVTVNADARIGEHCILNTNSSVDHDCVLENFVHLSPNAALAGNVVVKEGAHLGIGASVIQGIEIGKWAVVGAGAVVIEDVPDFAVVVGNPGRIIKYREDQPDYQSEK